MELFVIADNRVCNRCGARAGHCSHLPSQEHARYISRAKDLTVPKEEWSVGETVAAEILADRGLSYEIIGERLGRSPAAVRQKLDYERRRAA